jgi:hypothetical protein
VTSNINFAAINENFPVAGQDNDTQVFRDNFDTIKTNFREAKTEIEDLQNNTAKTNDDNNFNGSIIANATLQNTSVRKKDYGEPITAPTQEVSFIQAMYHIIRVGTPSCSLSFTDFPTEVVDVEGIGKIGKATLELYGDGTARTITFLTSGSTVIKKSSDFPGTVTVTSTTDPTLIEVWQHSSDIIFLNYLGEFN